MTRATRASHGYAAWRLIAEELRTDLADGRLPAGSRLAPEHELAERFGVTRQTVRRAVAALAAEGLLEARRGSGTYATDNTTIVHRIGVRTRLSRSLEGTGESAAGRVLAEVDEVPPADVAAQLRLTSATALRIESVGGVGGRPLSRSTSWWDPLRTPGIAAALREHVSVTQALRTIGIDDYLRASTTITARHATAEEALDLGLEPGAVVLITRALDVLPDGTPLQVVITRFSAARTQLEIEHAEASHQEPGGAS